MAGAAPLAGEKNFAKISVHAKCRDVNCIERCIGDDTGRGGGRPRAPSDRLPSMARAAWRTETPDSLKNQPRPRSKPVPNNLTKNFIYS